METKTINCQICNVEVKNITGKRKYCSKCRKVRDKELNDIKRDQVALERAEKRKSLSLQKKDV